MKLMFDERWIGKHGIGRIAAEMRRYLLGREDVDFHAVPQGPKFSVRDFVRIPSLIRELHPDLYYSPGFNPPVQSSCPMVFTICDLIPLHFPDERRLLKTIYFNTLLCQAGRRAAAILTISEFSRKQILEWGGFNHKKVRVVYPAAGRHFNPVGREWAAEKPYYLYLGNETPHKNVERMIRAFGQSGLERDFDLLLAGMERGRWSSLISDLKLDGSVHQLGPPPDEELPALYRGAYAFVFASLYEGFGLPPLEAMACGSPVIVSASTSLPEVVGDAGIYVDPEDVDSIAFGMREMAEDQELHARLVEKGLKRSEMFSWERAAQETWQVLQEAAQA